MRLMTPNEIIRYAFGDITYRQWDNYRFRFFYEWCILWAEIEALPLRSMMTNQPLYNWYCHEFNEVEKAFYEDFKGYFFAGVDYPKKYIDLLTDRLKILKSHYPMPILKMIKRAYKAEIHETD